MEAGSVEEMLGWRVLGASLVPIYMLYIILSIELSYLAL